MRRKRFCGRVLPGTQVPLGAALLDFRSKTDLIDWLKSNSR